jgi:hypothetical protein
MDAIEVLKTRRAVRVYKREPVPRKIIEDIVDCGRLAATAINIQPWIFVVLTDPEARRRIANTTDYGKFIADAPVCIVVLCCKVPGDGLHRLPGHPLHFDLGFHGLWGWGVWGTAGSPEVPQPRGRRRPQASAPSLPSS